VVILLTKVGREMEFEQRCRRVTEIACRVLDFATISSACQLEVSQAEEAAFRSHLSPGSWLWPIVTSGVVKGVSSEEDVAKIARTLASQTVVSAAKVLSAACVVFGHSIVDDIFSQSCAFAIECDPNVSKTVNHVGFLQEAASTAVRTLCNTYACGIQNKYMEELLSRS
jgi:hypothetical protein